MVGTGVYTIKDGEKIKTRFRGFNTSSKLDFFELLETAGSKTSLSMPIKRVVSLGEWLIHKRAFRVEDLNQFIDQNRTLDLNFDVKRNWDFPCRSGKSLLNTVINSTPLCIN